MLSQIGINLAAVFVLFIARLLGFDVYGRVLHALRRMRTFLRFGTRRHRVYLVYTDCDDDSYASDRLASAIKQEFKSKLDSRVDTIVLREATELLRWPLIKRHVAGVVVLLTDVTQLASKVSERKVIQERLTKYVTRGGCLILGHDVLYRRSRNDRLQRLAGCRLDGFVACTGPVHYERVNFGARKTSHSSLLESLPTKVALMDNEVVSGGWQDDVEYLYVWSENREIPLATRRRTGRGVVFWVNSGDHGPLGPPRSVARPEEGLVRMVTRLLHDPDESATSPA